MKEKTRVKTGLLAGLVCLIMILGSCGGQESLAPLPAPERDGGMFGVDVNINMATIDDYLERPDVAYRDMRMMYDPADFEAIGGISRMTRTLPGYRITPLPYIATLNAMPVEGMYDAEKLFDVVWSEEGEILSVVANYQESEQILNELFPKNQVIFLMCGGAGYSFLTRNLLVHMGWDENLIYSTGGNWYYEGNKALELEIAGGGIATWRVDYACIDFEHLTPVR